MSQYEKMLREIEEFKQKEIDEGYFGEEIEKWERREPRPPRRLALGCYEELKPLYTFLVEYAQRSAKAGQPLPFDVNLIKAYSKYRKVLHQYNKFEFRFVAFSLSVASGQVIEMIEEGKSFHSGMEMLYNSLTHCQLPGHLHHYEVSNAYRGKHFEALVDRYIKRIEDYYEEGKRIAAENLKERGTADE